ncbi:alpha/beta hydrolase [Microvirga splendida]|uniref:Dienelactone hydrolase family protein n=1 Tax=Microvirga splendida TaxID=2795727 RepID=A0ABS0Y7T4_9HYPH|nr:dienelactone hydrolase family protein [Microvirga splendida]MBJ6128362.1 dienelactone hydrolase family protein [Microvirga splendida]
MDSRTHADALVILLHGVGSDGQNMMGLADAWRPLLPGAVFAAPDGAFAFEHGPGRQWFSIAGVTDENRPERIAAARPAFDQIIRTQLEHHDFEHRLDRVVFVGFSQGSMMLLDAVASGRWPVAAGVAFSGRLASPPPIQPAHGTKLLLLHGAADGVVPATEMGQARATLQAYGLDIDSQLFPGLGHTISAEGAAMAQAFIAASLAAEDSLAR